MDSVQFSQALYAAFDLFPSAKGAATHIMHASQSLFDHYNGGTLYVLGNDELPRYQKEDSIEIVRFKQPIDNFLERAQVFGAGLAKLLKTRSERFELCQFRDPWSGIPILEHVDASQTTVYEVNGLPSIELQYAYPNLPKRTLDKIASRERYCLQHCDHIITPSAVTKQYLVKLNVAPDKISVVPNGAMVTTEALPRPIESGQDYLIYFGALQPWQGIDTLLRAIALLPSHYRLVICSSTKPNRNKNWVKLANRLGVNEQITWLDRLSKKQLAQWVSHAFVSLAPLTECTRNLTQGCCPLKILESMSFGVPVIASDLPVVREIISPEVNGCLVPADRPEELAREIQIFYEQPSSRRRMGLAARETIQEQFSWQQNDERLDAIYQSLKSKVGTTSLTMLQCNETLS